MGLDALAAQMEADRIERAKTYDMVGRCREADMSEDFKAGYRACPS